MNYLSVCSGIEAASVAWKNLGWKPVGFSEIESFLNAVLKHYYPEVINYGDINDHAKWELPTIDLLVGGTPCQSFSIAGLRKGLEDPRGNIMLTYIRILESRKPKWVVWENVPGVLSSNGGRDFGTFLGSLGKLGYGFAYRVLDAQWFGVAQRRRRVFVVGCFGDAVSAAKVLFESESVSRNPAPSREAGKRIAADARSGVASGGICWSGSDQANTERLIDIAGTLNCNKGQRGGYIANCGLTHDVAACLRSGGNGGVPSSRGEHLVVGSLDTECGANLGSGFRSDGTPVEPVVITSMAVRRLTPIECERLQGFPDNYTQIPYRNKLAENCPDGPRYKALGNSMAVTVMRWIGERIDKVSKEESA